MKLTLTNTAFWDTKPELMDENTHADFIITRVFQYGLETDIRTIIHFYTPAQIKKALTTQRGIDKNTLAFASVLGFL